MSFVICSFAMMKFSRKENALTGGEVVSPMAALLQNLAPVATQILTFVGQICTTIMAQPLLLMTVGILLLGGAIGIFGRLLSRN